MLRHSDPTPTTIDGYLHELRQRLEAELPSERVDDLVAETESHLREREAALREMEGGEPELEAVRGFVAASNQASELVASDAADRWALGARRLRTPVFWSVAALPLFGPFIAPLTQSAHPWFVLLPAGLAPLAGVSFVSRLADTRRLRRIALGVALAGCIGLSLPFVDHSNSGGPFGTRWELGAQAAKWDTIAIEHERQLATAANELRKWERRGSRPNELPEGAVNFVPSLPFPSLVTPQQYSEKVRQAQGKGGQSWLAVLEAQAQEARVTQLRYASAMRAAPDLVIGGVWFAWLLLAGCLAVMTDFVFSRLGAKLHQRRRSRLQRR